MLNSLRTKRLELDVPIDVLAALSGVPASTLSLADRGTKDLPIDRFRQVDATLNELRELVAFHAPVPISWRDVSAIRDLIDHMRRAKRHPDPWELLREISSSDPDSVCQNHQWSRDELLQRLTSAREELQTLTTSLQSQASV